MGGPSSTSWMSLFLIAKPTPCSLGSSSPFTVPEECVFLLFEASRTSKAGFLQGCNVDVQPSQLSANYGSFTWAISVPYVRGQSGQHRSHIPTPKSESLPFSV